MLSISVAFYLLETSFNPVYIRSQQEKGFSVIRLQSWNLNESVRLQDFIKKGGVWFERRGCMTQIEFSDKIHHTYRIIRLFIS